MRIDCINSIDITSNNSDIVTIDSSSFNHFYIANIDDKGDEINYKISNNNLYANYFMIKILGDDSSSTHQAIERLLDKPDIVSVKINFNNGNSQVFDIAKRRILDNGKLINKYESVFLDNKDLCIMISDKDIRYSKELFA